MKKSGLLVLVCVCGLGLGFIFNSCKKINEATDLGGGLVPAIDNINTFETFLPVQTDNVLYNDSTKLDFFDEVALGAITNDPEFGQTQASVYLNFAPKTMGSYPFYKKDSVQGIDSVVLSLAYDGAYGDTNSLLNVRVFEIDPAANFKDTVAGTISQQGGIVRGPGVYSFNVPDFPVLPTQLGSKSFRLSDLNDSITLVRKRDTTKTANVLRIRLSTAFANKFIDSTTTYQSPGKFYNLFKGLAVKADMQGNALGYFAIGQPGIEPKTRLTIYYRVQKNGVIDTTSYFFMHGDDRSGERYSAQANVIKRTPAAGFATYLAMAGTNDDKLYIAADPGSAGVIRIPALDTFNKAKIIYRAELILPKLTSSQSDIFHEPFALFLDRITGKDTGYSVIDDILATSFPKYPLNIANYGGLLKSDSTYRFNLTRHVQNIISHADSNYRLRVYAPFEDLIYVNPSDPLFQKRLVSVLGFPAAGRVVLGGGSLINPTRRMRLRVVYSKLL